MTKIDVKKIQKLSSQKRYSHIRVSSPVSGDKVRILNANVQHTQVLPSYWDVIRKEALQDRANALGIKDFLEKPKVVESHVAHAEVLQHINILNDPKRVIKTDVDKYLYTHASIISSVNVEEDEHTIKVASIKDINKNGDAWETKNLLATYKTFIGAYNYLEHVQIPAMRKGWIIDAVPRLAKNEDGEKFAIVDILVATERAHKSLIAVLESGELNSLSMGCSCKFTICSRCGYVSANEMDVCNHIPREKLQAYTHSDGTKRYIAELCLLPDTKVLTGSLAYKYITDIKKDDYIISHTGNERVVLKTFERNYTGELVVLRVEGESKRLESTPDHPHFVYDREKDVFGFKKASNIVLGDFLCKPVPDFEEDQPDMSLDKARLLGLFLAEGGISGNTVQIHLNANDELELATWIRDTLEANFNDSQHYIYHYDRTDKEYNEGHNILTDSGDTRVIKATSKKLIVQTKSKLFIEFLSKYCSGKKVFDKGLSTKALKLPVIYQKEVLLGWLNGDGHQDFIGRIHGATVSENLFESMSLLSLRCGLWNRNQIVFDGKMVETGEMRAMNKDVSSIKDSKNWRPRFTIHFTPVQAPDIARALGWEQHMGKRNKFIEKNGYFLHKVTAVSKKEYSGPVYNLEVDVDNSFIIDGFATHNCGHHSDASATVFEEASWVYDPAFVIAEAKKRVASVKKTSSPILSILDIYNTKKKVLSAEPEDTGDLPPLEDAPADDAPEADMGDEGDLGGDLGDAPEGAEGDEGDLGDELGGDLGGGGAPGGLGGGGGGGMPDEDEEPTLDSDIPESLNIFTDQEVPKYIEIEDSIVDRWYKNKLRDLETRKPLRDIDHNQTFHEI